MMIIVGENGSVKYVARIQKGPGYRISIPKEVIQQLPFEPDAFEIKVEGERIVLCPIKVKK